ncbi:FHA domain-containing protein [Melittangium boletus]|uniref:FHA domain-containing protein n=1 Tax=Melittangium boletus TaxID=83453 RepID=UPI003DA43823
MPSVKELRARARVDVGTFQAEYGPVALIQQPPSLVFQKVAQQMGRSRTVFMAHRSRLADRLVSMLQGFEHLQVLFLQPASEGQVFAVGRLETSSLVVHDPSVSKFHALLRWSAADNTCYVRDSGSMNGTYVNTVQLGEEEQQLWDGDGLAFGDAQFLYVSTQTLHAHLNTAVPTSVR